MQRFLVARYIFSHNRFGRLQELQTPNPPKGATRNGVLKEVLGEVFAHFAIVSEFPVGALLEINPGIDCSGMELIAINSA